MLESVVQTGVPTVVGRSDARQLGSPEERYFTFTYSPIIAGSGDIPGVCAAAQQRSARLDHYRELLHRKPGALEHSLALRQEREQSRRQSA